MPAPSINDLDPSVFLGLQSDDGPMCTIEATVATGMEDVCAEEVRDRLGSTAVTATGRAFFDIAVQDVNKVFQLRSAENIHVIIHMNSEFVFSNDRDECFTAVYQLVSDPLWRKGMKVWQQVFGAMPKETFSVDKPLEQQFQEAQPCLDLFRIRKGSPVDINLPPDIKEMLEQIRLTQDDKCDKKTSKATRKDRKCNKTDSETADSDNKSNQTPDTNVDDNCTTETITNKDLESRDKDGRASNNGTEIFISNNNSPENIKNISKDTLPDTEMFRDSISANNIDGREPCSDGAANGTVVDQGINTLLQGVPLEKRYFGKWDTGEGGQNHCSQHSELADHGPGNSRSSSCIDGEYLNKPDPNIHPGSPDVSSNSPDIQPGAPDVFSNSPDIHPRDPHITTSDSDGVTPTRDPHITTSDSDGVAPTDETCLTPLFRVSCNRSGLEHVFGSQEAARQLGASINDRFNWKVDLKRFQVEVILDISQRFLYVSLALTREPLFQRNLVAFGPTNLRGTLSYALLHLAKPDVGDVVMDHMCGGGSIPLEGALSFPSTYHLAGDMSPRAVERARTNFDHASITRRLSLAADVSQWDATRLPLRNSSVDVVVSDLPFGKRSGSKMDNRVLYLRALQETARVTRPTTGRAVLLTHDRNSMIRNLVHTKKYWKNRSTRTINIGGLYAAVFLLTRTSALFTKGTVDDT